MLQTQNNTRYLLTYNQCVTLPHNKQVQALISFLGPFIAVSPSGVHTTCWLTANSNKHCHRFTLVHYQNTFSFSPQRNNLQPGKVHRAYRGMCSLCGPHSVTDWNALRTSLRQESGKLPQPRRKWHNCAYKIRACWWWFIFCCTNTVVE